MSDSFEYYRPAGNAPGRYLIIIQDIGIEDIYEFLPVVQILPSGTVLDMGLWRFRRRVKTQRLPRHVSKAEQDACKLCKEGGYYWGQRAEETILFEAGWK